MRISGPHRDRKAAEGTKAWYLDFYVPRMNPDGTAVLKDGCRVLRRLRPRYKTRDLAIADLHNIKSQFESAGVGHAGILTRTQATEYEQAKFIAPEASVAELAQFWRRYHPVQKTLKIGELIPIFLAANEARVGVTRHGVDLKSRLGMFGREMPLEAFGVVLTASRADLGGLLTLHFPTGEMQVFDQLKAIYTISLVDLERAQSATTTASRILTVENTKTTLRRLVAADGDQSTLIAGCSFPSKALIRLLELLPPEIPIYHFGDTDPAGFQILATLRERAPQRVYTFMMRHRPGKSGLTEYDRTLLPGLLRNPQLVDVRTDLDAMKASGMKGDFEQETLGLPQLECWPFFTRAIGREGLAG